MTYSYPLALEPEPDKQQPSKLFEMDAAWGDDGDGDDNDNEHEDIDDLMNQLESMSTTKPRIETAPVPSSSTAPNVSVYRTGVVHTNTINLRVVGEPTGTVYASSESRHVEDDDGVEWDEEYEEDDREWSMRFQDRVSLEPRQVLRYYSVLSRDNVCGNAIFASRTMYTTPRIMDVRCRRCSGNSSIELQLMPALISLLKFDVECDWSTVSILVCSDCCSDGQWSIETVVVEV